MPPEKKATAAPAAVEEDVTMRDVPAASETESANVVDGGEGLGEGEEDDAVLVFDGEQRIRTLPGSSDTAASFEFKNEDHTLGNSLRYIIMKNPDVEFCGCSIPHPSEPLMNIRIQTYEGTTAVQALEKGFTDLMSLCDVVADKFSDARAEYNASPKE